MLVITRRTTEEVVIGDPRDPLGIIRVVAVRGDRVRLAFIFPQHIAVHRREVAEVIATGDSASGGAAAAVPPTNGAKSAPPTTPLQVRPRSAPHACQPAFRSPDH